MIQEILYLSVKELLNMTRKTKIIIILILVFLILLIFLLVHLYAKKNLIGLPTGQLSYSEESPDKTKKMNVYYIDGGSISADALRIEIASNSKKYNVYYCYKNCNFDKNAKWIDDNTIVVNNRKININKQRIKEG